MSQDIDEQLSTPSRRSLPPPPFFPPAGPDASADRRERTRPRTLQPPFGPQIAATAAATPPLTSTPTTPEVQSHAPDQWISSPSPTAAEPAPEDAGSDWPGGLQRGSSGTSWSETEPPLAAIADPTTSDAAARNVGEPASSEQGIVAASAVLSGETLMQERGADEGELLEDAHGDNVHASSVVGSAQPSDAEANTGEEACGHALADAADSSAVESDSDQAAPPVPATFAWGAELPAIQEAGTSGRVGTYGYLAGKHDQNDVPLPVVGGLESGVSSESLRHYKEIEPWPVTPTGHPALSKEAQIGQVAGLVAGALERVAQRLRSGELRLPEEPPPTSDESALATALAALLRGTER